MIRRVNPDICFGHFEINQFQLTPGHIETNGLPRNIFLANTKLTYSGHLHIISTWKNITYVGCPYQLNWNDYGNDKGIHLIYPRNLHYEFIPNDDSPTHQKVFLSKVSSSSSDDLRKSLTKNFVKLVVDCSVSEKLLSETIAHLETLGPLTLSVVYTTEGLDSIYKDLDGDLLDMDDEDTPRSPSQLLDEYIARVTHPQGIAIQRLRKYVKEIQNEIQST